MCALSVLDLSGGHCSWMILGGSKEHQVAVSAIPEVLQVVSVAQRPLQSTCALILHLASYT